MKLTSLPARYWEPTGEILTDDDRVLTTWSSRGVTHQDRLDRADLIEALTGCSTNVARAAVGLTPDGKMVKHKKKKTNITDVLRKLDPIERAKLFDELLEGRN